MIKVKKITYTPANIVAMFATPQIVLPAPPSGYVNNIMAISHELVFGTAAYTGGSFLFYDLLRPGLTIISDGTMLPAGGNMSLPANKASASTQLIASTTKNLYVTTDLLCATGDSPIDAYIVYEVVKIT